MCQSNNMVFETFFCLILSKKEWQKFFFQKVVFLKNISRFKGRYKKPWDLHRVLYVQIGMRFCKATVTWKFGHKLF